MLGVSFIFRKGVATFCEHKLGMPREKARKVSRFAAIGVTVLTLDIPGAVGNFAEDMVSEVAGSVIENKIT